MILIKGSYDRRVTALGGLMAAIVTVPPQAPILVQAATILALLTVLMWALVMMLRELRRG